ncbi:MAG: PDZ domain-containing protein, partial [Burkholderiales bacterium]
GTGIRIELVREGERRIVDATVGQAPSAEATASAGSAATTNALTGATLGEISRDHPSFGEVEGVLIAQVTPGSRAAANGLQAGDIITEVNRREVSSVAALQEIVRENTTGTLALTIVREGNEQFMIVR